MLPRSRPADRNGRCQEHVGFRVKGVGFVKDDVEIGVGVRGEGLGLAQCYLFLLLLWVHGALHACSRYFQEEASEAMP